MYDTELKYSVGFQGGVKVDGKYWFPSFAENALLYCDNTGNVEYAGKFFKEKSNTKLYGDVQYYKNKLIFVPLGAQNIAVYDLVQKKFDFIPLKNQLDRITGLFFASIIWNDFLYLFPSFYPGILKVNLNNWNMELIDEWIEQIQGLIVSSQDAYFRSDFVQRGPLVYLAFCNAHAVLEFNLCNKNVRIFNVGETGYSTIAYDGEEFWLAPRGIGAIVRWNPKNENIHFYRNFPMNYHQGSAVGSFCFGDYYWIFPECANMVLKVNIHTGDIKESTLFSDICNAPYSIYSIWNASFIYCKKKENVVTLCTGRSSEICCLDLISGVVRKKTIKMPMEVRADYEMRIQNKYEKFLKKESERSVHIESSWYTLMDFMDYIDAICVDNQQEQNVGEIVFTFCHIIGKGTHP